MSDQMPAVSAAEWSPFTPAPASASDPSPVPETVPAPVVGVQVPPTATATQNQPQPAPEPAADPTPAATRAPVHTPELAPVETPVKKTNQPDPQASPAPAEPEVDTATAASHTAALFARRRRRYLNVGRAVLAAAAVIGWMHWTGSSEAPGVAAGPKVHRQAVAPADQIGSDMRTVHRHLANGTLESVSTPGAKVAAAGRTLYIARVIDGTCLVYGVIDGKDIAPQADPSGAACTTGIEQVQQQLDAAETNRRAASNAALESSLTHAAESAGFYASMNYRAGVPSLSGIAGSDLGDPTVRVTGNRGTYARLSARSDGLCRTALVDSFGELGEISPC